MFEITGYIIYLSWASLFFLATLMNWLYWDIKKKNNDSQYLIYIKCSGWLFVSLWILIMIFGDVFVGDNGFY